MQALTRSRFPAPEDVEKINVPAALLPSKDEDMKVVREAVLNMQTGNSLIVDEQDIRGYRGEEQGKERFEGVPYHASRLDGRSR